MLPPDKADGLKMELVKSGLIPAFVAVVVAVVGVGLNQLVERHNKTTEAENTARVVERNLWEAEDALSRSYSDRRYRLYGLEVNIPLDDEKRLADKLHDSYAQVAAAAAVYRLEVARASEKHPFVQDDVVQLACAAETVARGRKALNEVTEVAGSTVQKDVRSSTRACRGETVRDVAQLFYDNYVDGNGTDACDHLFGKAVKTMKRKSPNCDEDVPRPEHPPELHPYARATFGSDKVDGGTEIVNVKLQTAAGRTVANLVMSDKDKDNYWHIDEVRHLKTVTLPRIKGKEKGTAQHGSSSLRRDSARGDGRRLPPVLGPATARSVAPTSPD